MEIIRSLNPVRAKYYVYILSLFAGVLLSFTSPWFQADVGSYESWSQYFVEGSYFGLTQEWVYPYIAIVPMVLANSLTFLPHGYILSWIVIIFSLNIAAFTIFEKTFRSKINFYQVLAYSFVNVFLFAIFLFRLDGIAIPLTLISVAIFRKHKYVSFSILFVITLIKIWPVAFIVGFWLLSKTKIKDTLFLSSLFVFLLVIPNFFGKHVFAFLSIQKSRGIQVESIFAFPFSFSSNAFYWDSKILTWQVDSSSFNSFYLSFATYAMFIIIAAVGFIFYYKNRKDFTFEKSIILSAYIMLIFITFNKIGSPQFLGWMQVIIFSVAVSFAWNKSQKILLTLILLTTVFTGAMALFYADLLYQTPIGIALLALKSFSLIGLTIYYTFLMFKEKNLVEVGNS